MKRIKVMIVDDEPGAHKILGNYIERTSELELVSNASNAIEALSFLETSKADLIFLDITMPEIDGFTFLNKLQRPPYVIFTTAHSEFAVESYEYNAVDYLKKPIPFDRFAKAINKLQKWIEKGMSMEPVKESIELKIGGNIKSILLNQVLYIQSLGNYVKIYLTNKTLISQITTTELEVNLPKTLFVRIHKSFIVNKSKITQLLDDELIIGDRKLPIGKTFKKYVKELISINH